MGERDEEGERQARGARMEKVRVREEVGGKDGEREGGSGKGEG